VAKIQAVAGRDIERQDEKAQVLAALHNAIALVESGELEANRVAIILANNQVEIFEFRCLFWGRALEMMGLLEIGRGYLLDVTVDG
jgi:hypothetical protein